MLVPLRIGEHAILLDLTGKALQGDFKGVTLSNHDLTHSVLQRYGQYARRIPYRHSFLLLYALIGANLALIRGTLSAFAARAPSPYP